ncbi:MAG: hypothetical protein JWN17_247 [Frankiales bacterium]|nr:hypothetical protein [Frankiales bacterium]
MASKRDLVEAHAFNRRRLVTAFVSGSPGGRELEPGHPLRAVLAGLALAVLLVVGAAVGGFLRPGLPAGWDDNTLVVARDSGARYVATSGKLYPVANTTSARLLLPAEDFRVVLAPDEKIALEDRGDSVGIVGAPDALPDPKALVETGWTSCLDRQGRTRQRLARAPGAAPAPEGSAVLVRSGRDLVVVTGRSRLRVSTRAQTATLRALGLDAVDPVPAPGRWLDLFPAGPDLAPLTAVYVGKPLPPGAPRPGGASVYGTLVLVPEAGGADRTYLLTPQGLSPLSPVAAALYAVGAGGRAGRPVKVSQAEVASLRTTEALEPEEWPQVPPTPLNEPVACALLTASPDQLPSVQLAVPVDGQALPATTSDAVVEPARGALVRAVSGGIVNRGTVFLVDQTASRYALGAPEEQVQAQLGYAGVPLTAVPTSWLEALRDGPELSATAAQQVVSARTGP